MKKAFSILALCSLFSINNAVAEHNTESKKLLDLLHKQQKQISNLEKKIDSMADNMDDNIADADSNSSLKKLSIGGYGELHLSQGDKKEIDFHRFVLEFGYEFTDKIKLVSELELEHSVAGDGESGEIELEQAYIEFSFNNNLDIDVGIFLIPVGILNETHEPTTFYGVEQNRVEKYIILSSWWEGGAKLSQNFATGISYDIALHSGLSALDSSGNIDFDIRSGREKVAEAEADSGATTARIKYTALSGVELAFSLQYQQDLAQGRENQNISAILYEAHIDLKREYFGLRALYARWDIDSKSVNANGRDEQLGYYLEPSWKWSLSNNSKLGVFARYSLEDRVAGNSDNTEIMQKDFGLNFWPHKQVVLKADISYIDNPSSEDETIYNFGISYDF